VYWGRSLACGQNGEWDKAIADLNEAIRLKPDFAEAYYGRGIFYGKRGDWDKAIADCNEAIHDPDLRKESTSQDHRTMTLVFAKERSILSMKEALESGRTIVWFKDQLIGREELLNPFFAACIEVSKPTIQSKTHLFVEVRNNCQADIHLEQIAALGSHPVVLPARATTLLKVTTADTSKPVELRTTATNFLIAPKKGLAITLTIPAMSN
jgi:tetratricopeptide (TPR) repeat protein